MRRGDGSRDDDDHDALGRGSPTSSIRSLTEYINGKLWPDTLLKLRRHYGVVPHELFERMGVDLVR